MKVFIIGGKGDPAGKESVKLETFCKTLGLQLAASDHQVVLCSEWRTSADYQVLLGMASSEQIKVPEKLIIHRPDDNIIRQGWRDLEHQLGFVEPRYESHIGPAFRDANGEVESGEGLRLAFLLCQLAALKECDVVVTVGGRLDGPAAMLLAVAREQRVPILPFRFLGGAAEKVYNQLEGELRRRLDKNVEKLSHEEDGAAAVLKLIEELHKKTFSTNIRIFMSYSWKRGDYADLVEAILRRRENVFVFRDESEILSGESIPEKIRYELENQCDVFLALWGREYVESPHCYDEMQLWYNSNGLDRLYLLRFDQTRPVWPWLRKSLNDMSEFARKWPEVDCSKGRPVIEKELADFIDRLTSSGSD